MSKKECPSCAMMVESKEKACPICGYEFTDHPVSYKWIAIFLVLLFLLLIIF